MSQAPVPSPVADLELRDRAALLGETLVIADLHLGQGAEALAFPVGDGAGIVRRVRELLAWAEPAELVVAGDLLHSFETVPRTVRDAIESIREATDAFDATVIALEGNHDAMLASVWDGELRESHKVAETVICHGHEQPADDAGRYVIGHEHPVLAVAGRRRPCYLAGEEVYEGADVVVLPAFSALLRGVEINGLRAGEFMSPLVGDPDALAPVVWDVDARESVPFPPLGAFRERL